MQNDILSRSDVNSALALGRKPSSGHRLGTTDCHAELVLDRRALDDQRWWPVSRTCLAAKAARSLKSQ